MTQHIALLYTTPATTRCLDPTPLLALLTRTYPSTVFTLTATAETTGIVWLPNLAQGDTSSSLAQFLNDAPKVRFVQLPMTGVDDFLPLIEKMSSEGRAITWCCAKGCYAEPVAEHALALILTLYRDLVGKAGESRSLFDNNVVIVGNGSIANALLLLLKPFRCEVTKLDSTTTREHVEEAFSKADVVVLACPLTTATRALINSTTLEKMSKEAILINVARGEIIDTQALITALKEGTIKAAGLDVISPLFKEHEREREELEREGRLLVTAHTAIPSRMIPTLLTQRIVDNIAHLTLNDFQYLGKVDASKGY